ncbi:aspartate:alanine exchanger family transporter [Anaeromyxobacter dehalogenans]|uniref:YidE/YbjL like transporter n=1 Tax=Anaeromyxobacter dehalogenans (strain 2CP-C) TaxID=290397 RepID=Q2IKA7_ANADE|nr:TrkA C-terminal domain-containing protein [Anaeromyxobacter dehalogenans]ABC82088.1 YidE/YbjL like transporter [Anaeromyxobacter dehalogenans 2CP-C]
MLDPLVRLLAQNPLLLLFLVAALGYPLGQIQVRGSRLGVASVLFVGLAAGALDPSLALPEIVYMLGLAIFVYAIGLSSGRAFVASLRRDGIRNTGLAVFAVGLAVALSYLARRLLGLDASLTAGLFAGATTSTPALAAAMETLKQAAPGHALSEPVVAYSICYPFGVVGVVLAVRAAWWLWKPDLAGEARRLAEMGAGNEPLGSTTVRVTEDMGALTLEELVRGLRWHVIFGRLRRGDRLMLAAPDVRLEAGDLVTVVGTPAELARVVERLGVVADEPIDADRSEFDLRRIFVSSPEVAGRTVAELDLPRRMGVVITRVRRGDVDLLPAPALRLEVGDRVRVLGPVKQLPRVTTYFGDSYRAASEVDILTFGLGLALGLLLGILPLPLPGGVWVSLGFAGGPLVVALVLGTMGRTGGMVWHLPFSASVALRQFGLTLFLAGIGTRAGVGFLATFASREGLLLFAAGAAITFATSLAALFVAHRLMKIPMSLALGMVAGIQTQPAVLGYALDQTGNEIPSQGYAAVYPAATIAKLLLVQLLVAFG